MEYNQFTIPYKITLIHKLFNKKYVFYKSTCEYLAFCEESFTCEIQHQKTPRTPRQDNKVQKLF